MGGAIIFWGNVAIWTWELLTRPDRDVFVEMIGSVVSLHALYLGAVVSTGILALGCSMAVVRRAWGMLMRMWRWFYQRYTDKGRFVAAVEENLAPGDTALTSRERFCSKLWELGIKPRRSENGSAPDWLVFRDCMAAYALEGRLDRSLRTRAS